MAVHPEYPGLTAQVMVNGEPLPEYEDTDAIDDPKVVTRYIEAQAGTTFEIVQVFPDNFAGSDDVLTKYYIDGQNVRSPIDTSAERKSVPKKKLAGVKEKKGNSWYRRPFQFQKLCVMEASDIDDREEAAMIGTIKLDLYRGKRGESARTSGSMQPKGPEQVSEAALKGEAKSLRVYLGTKKRSLRENYFKFVSAPEVPVATFVFKYRSRINLQALDIIPRDKSPSPPFVVKSRSSSLVSTPQNESAVKSEILRDATPVLPHVAGVILQTPRAASIAAPAPGLQQSTPRSTPMPPVVPMPTIPPSRQQTPAPSSSTDQDGLTVEEIIVMIAGYRGHDRGLTGQSQRSLLSLLKHYENKDSGSTQTAKGPDHADQHVRIKRERSDDSVAGGRQKKRKEREVIVLDD